MIGRALVGTVCTLGLCLLSCDPTEGAEAPSSAREKAAKIIESFVNRDDWAEASEELLLIGKPAIPELQAALRVATDPYLRMAFAAILYRLGERDGVKTLILLLDSDKAGVRRVAIRALRELTAQTIAYDPEAPKKERDAAVWEWRKWWINETLRRDPTSKQFTPIRCKVIATNPEAGVVVLKGGLDRGIMPGAKFSVSHGGEYVCIVAVQMVTREMCAANIIRGSAKGEVQTGDDALLHSTGEPAEEDTPNEK